MKICMRGIHEFEGKNCKKCEKIKQKIWREANREKAKKYAKEYRIKNYETCINKVKQYQIQNKDFCKKANEGWRLKNKEYLKSYHENNRERFLERKKKNYHKSKEISKIWEAKNPEKVKAKSRINSAKRRAIKKEVGGVHTFNDVMDKYISQEGKCKVCKIYVLNNYHVDHIIPLSRGGSNFPENIQILCPSCNLRKHAMTMDEFLTRIAV